jgi:AraC-like DNA-binding protein/mannose-6-phosphate isomerase-like protein (cupin superfamily)
MQLAKGDNYFRDHALAINVCKVNRMKNISHDNDLTEVEHHHDFIEIVFITKGKGTQVISNNEYDVSEGDIFILQGFQNHYFKNAGKAEIINVMYDPVKSNDLVSADVKTIDGYSALFILEPRYRDRMHFRNMLHLNRVDLAKSEYILNSMLHEASQKEPGYELFLKNKLEEIIIFLSRKYSQISIPKAKSLVRIGKAIDYIENNFHNNIYVQQLAELTFMSVRNFQRVFKEATGLSPNDYLLDMRIQYASKLLTETDSAIYDVSGRVGISDWFYFSKAFKKKFGVSPLNYRKQNKLA